MPGLGFRPANGVAQRERTVIERGGQALAVMRFVSTDAGTEITVEVRDKVLEEASERGAFDIHEISRSTAELRDVSGREYARRQQPNSMGYGQHEFGVFSRTIGFDPVAPDVRDVVLSLHGALGEWDVPISVVPLGETDVYTRHEIDASATRDGITVEVVGLARTPTHTVVEFAASAPDLLVRGVGAELQRGKTDLLALVGERGQRYVEEMSRETVVHPGSPENLARGYALFPAVPSEVNTLTLEVPHVVIEDPPAALEFDLPLAAPLTTRLGPYAVEVRSVDLVDNLLAPPGQPPGHGLRMAIGPGTSDDGPRFIRARKLIVDGTAHQLGWGWHPEPGMVNVDVHLPPDVEPKHLTLSDAVVRLRGPWEISFAVPRG